MVVWVAVQVPPRVSAFNTVGEKAEEIPRERTDAGKGADVFGRREGH